MLYENYIFDCDGVLLDSNNFKIHAMRHSLLEYPIETQEEFLTYFRENFGRSRYYHVEYFFKEILKQPVDEEKKNKILETYAKECIKEYLNCSICDGALELLSKLKDKKKWVVSGSDQNELRVVFEKRNLSVFFNDVLGSPTKKADHIKNIIESNNICPQKTCLIGDSISDYEASISTGISFIFCKKYSNTPELYNFFKQSEIQIINTLEDLS